MPGQIRYLFLGHAVVFLKIVSWNVKKFRHDGFNFRFFKIFLQFLKRRETLKFWQYLDFKKFSGGIIAKQIQVSLALGYKNFGNTLVIPDSPDCPDHCCSLEFPRFPYLLRLQSQKANIALVERDLFTFLTLEWGFSSKRKKAVCQDFFRRLQLFDLIGESFRSKTKHAQLSKSNC